MACRYAEHERGTFTIEPSTIAHCTTAVRPAKLVAPARPIYPAPALRRSAQGGTILLVTIGANGAVLDVRVESSSTNQSLDQASVQSAEHSEFASAFCDAHALVATLRYSVHFRLNTRTGIGTATVGQSPWRGRYLDVPQNRVPIPQTFAF